MLRALPRVRPVYYMPDQLFLECALPAPLRRRFDYLPPAGITAEDVRQWPLGTLVRVPFGHQEVIGVFLTVKSSTSLSSDQLKAAIAPIHDTAIPTEVLELCLWGADYYHYPIGEALHAALPALLRQGEPARLPDEIRYRLTVAGKGLPTGALRRAPKQALLLNFLQDHDSAGREELESLAVASSQVKALTEKGLVESFAVAEPQLSQTLVLREQPLPLEAEQESALNQLSVSGFQVSLLDGATGSGKTEVYLQAIGRILAEGKQALVLVPEIGLTPQTLARFQRRFALPIVALHSGLNDRERLDAWIKARDGIARIIIGTRSAIFTPLAQPGIIIIDEEHDPSFKQQEGFRYSARDLAVIRARSLAIPLMLGSATPSLETLYNALNGRYQHLRLTRRAGNAESPSIELLDIRGKSLHQGFAPETLAAIATEVNAGNQVLVFLNRRGYAPSLQCHDCGWLANCNHCDARLTVHQHPRHLHCHHCDHQGPIPHRCPACHSNQLLPLGQGTERSEEALQHAFPTTRILRVDRDSTRARGAMNKLLQEIHSGHPCILVGTQMLAKGHHFPNVTLVAIVDADAGLFSADFRGPERMGQMLVQVAGRAGRAEKPGRVMLQSHHTEHPLVQTLFAQGYHTFAKAILQERHAAQLPPYRYLALLRAESKRAELAVEFLRMARQQAMQLHASSPHLHYLGPLPAMLEKRGDRFRYQLQFNSAHRKSLHALMERLIQQLESHALAKRVRWTIDIDPQDMI